MRRPAVLLALASMLLLWSAPAASAHPLGNFTVNRYAGLVVGPGEVVVNYVLDLAEIPAFQEEPSIDLDGDGVEEAELQTWSADVAGTIVDGLALTVDDRPLPLDVRGASASMLPGQGGLETLRLEATLSAPVGHPSGTLVFEDRNEPGRLGWREITATATDGLALVAPTVPASSVSDRLRSYPDDLLSSPLSVTKMRAGFRPGANDGDAAAVVPAGNARPFADGGPFAALIGREGIPLMLLGLIVAVGLGAWHALLPGHGKTLMAAAMVGSVARTRQAVVVGVSVAAMHTFSVIALGLAVLALEQAFRPEAVYPWLGAASGVAAVAIGVHLARGRWSSWRAARAPAADGHDHHDGPLEHKHKHNHEHDHDHGPLGHDHSLPAEGLLSRRGITALAFAGGILPAPSALIVMLAAIQGQRVAYGLGLVLAFSVGLAVSLVVVGLGAMRARTIMDGRLSERISRLVPLVSASVIVVVGMYVIARSLVSI